MATERRRPLRTDALRSAESLTAAAKAAVADKGLDVSTNEIVKRAGVGPATFYRRFPSRQVLLETIQLEGLDRLEEQARAALDRAEAGKGFVDLLVALASAQAADKGLSQTLAEHSESVAVNKARSRLRSFIKKVTERAQTTGDIRYDLSWRDVPFLASAASSMSATCLNLRAGDVQRDRIVAIILDGIRSRDAAALPGKPPA